VNDRELRDRLEALQERARAQRAQLDRGVDADALARRYEPRLAALDRQIEALEPRSRELGERVRAAKAEHDLQLLRAQAEDDVAQEIGGLVLGTMAAGGVLSALFLASSGFAELGAASAIFSGLAVVSWKSYRLGRGERREQSLTRRRPP